MTAAQAATAQAAAAESAFIFFFNENLARKKALDQALLFCIQKLTLFPSLASNGKQKYAKLLSQFVPSSKRTV